MSLEFKQRDTDESGGYASVWKDAAGNLAFIQAYNANTDGTRRSYSVSDFWGERSAVNNLCNAMSDACAGLSSSQLRERRMVTQLAASEGWPRDKLAATKIDAGIIPMPNGKPCPEVDGYLVSATALHKPNPTNLCNISNYVDALAVPAIVIPKKPKMGQSEFATRGVAVGDLVAAVRLTGDLAVLGVVGDQGPPDKLGEASLAMNGALLGKNAPPENFLEVRGKTPKYAGKGWVAPPTFTLIFAGSRDRAQPYMTVERINPVARKRFDDWGGLERANACIRAMRS